MVFEAIDKKIIVIAGLVALYLFYRLFLKEKKENQLDRDYNKVLNSEEYKVKSQWKD